MMYYLFLWASWIVPRVPRWLLYRLPALFGSLAWLVAVPARRRATNNALHVLGLDVRQTAAGRRQLRRVVRGMFRTSVNNYLEAFLLPGLAAEEVLEHLEIKHIDALEEALALGKGVILFSAHFGPFEYLAKWFSAKGYQVIIPVEKLKDQRMLDLMVRLRSSSGVTFVPLGGSAPMRAIFQALRKNQIVLITADRAVEGESVIKPFFGAPACLPIGPVDLSVRTGAPLVGALGWRKARQHLGGEFIPLTLRLPEEQRKQIDVVEDAVIRELERVIRTHPEQWVVFSKIWEDNT